MGDADGGAAALSMGVGEVDNVARRLEGKQPGYSR